VLHDDERGQTIPESSIIIDYLDAHYPGATRFVPSNPELAWQTRLRDRFIDLYIHDPMQKIVGDRLRPTGSKDPFGVEQAIGRLRTAYGIIEDELAGRTWAMGDTFGLADCAAAPALFYGNLVLPFGGTHKNLAAYYDRLMQRPSFARAVAEAKPYFHMFPQ
jgi:glutathione S-transferase